jgi:hypothetical protein
MVVQNDYITVLYSSGEVLFLSEIVEEVYGWLPIPECPFAPDKS